MPPRPRPELTPEQLALQLQRKQRKLDAAAKLLAEGGALGSTPGSSGTSTPAGLFDLASDRGKIKVREWAQLEKSPTTPGASVKIMTWNMLAQCLVRRELFPNSDCLRANQRENMVIREILQYGADIICLQEVDRLEKYLPIFHSANYEHTYASGPNKRHGCMILHRSDMFKKLAENTIFYDNEPVDWLETIAVSPQDGAKKKQRTGSSRITKNIGLMVALARKDAPDTGCIVGTTHLFWHPKFPYERARQAGLFLRAVRKLQASDPNYAKWPSYLTGDFNTEPEEAAYALLVGDMLSEAHRTRLSQSRVIHVSRDPSIDTGHPKDKDDDEEGEGEGARTEPDPTTLIPKTRPATREDGLLEDGELVRLYEGPPLVSAYQEGHKRIPEEEDNTFGVRYPPLTADGRLEPMWTSFTYYWRLTLDYIFVSKLPGGTTPRVIGILKTHRKQDLEPGLPLQGVCGSDHVSLVAEFSTEPA